MVLCRRARVLQRYRAGGAGSPGEGCTGPAVAAAGVAIFAEVAAVGLVAAVAVVAAAASVLAAAAGPRSPGRR